MEKKQGLVQDLDLDQMEKVNGGDEVVWLGTQPVQGSDENGKTCPWCGQRFSTDQIRDYHDHIMRDCPNLPPAPTIIG